MFFNTLEIRDFRCFVDKTLHLGKFITVLAGRNATGKSTILGMLANASEMKKGAGLTYFSKQFRSEFSEILKGSKAHDPIGPNKFRISLADDNGVETEYRQFRVAWQSPRKNSTKNLQKEAVKDSDLTREQEKIDNENQRTRFRVIPTYKDENGKVREPKFDLPVCYLGLSRLFPIGEADDEGIKSQVLKFDNEEDHTWFVENYKSLLSLYDDITSISGSTIGETDKKKAIGINTDKYDYLANSSGQDNIGQILLALLSFRKIHRAAISWRGGLLLIDEMDSTLHPSAQNKLMDIMISEARKLNIQIVMTTHSISLLKHICSKTVHNNSNVNNVELYYFTTANGDLEIRRNIEFEVIEGDLLVQSAIQTRKKIKVYSEDAETRWFFKYLADKYLHLLDILDVSLGCEELKSLLKADRVYFSNVILLFDGDVPIDFMNDSIIKRSKNVLKLPGTYPPEQVIYEYLLSLQPDHPYWQEGASSGFTLVYFKENGPGSSSYNRGDNREQNKSWFIAHQADFDATKLFAFWAEDNPKFVNDFINNFQAAYNVVAERLSIPRIKNQ